MKNELIKLWHEMLNSESDVKMETILVGIKAMMLSEYILWSQDNSREYFENEINTVAMAKNLDLFTHLCEVCMDF